MRSLNRRSVASSECVWPMSEPSAKSASRESTCATICAALLSCNVATSCGCAAEKRVSNAGSKAPAVR